MRSKLRVGVIGLGMGKAHIRGFQSHHRSEVVAISDINEERLAAVGDELNVGNRYADFQEMMDKENLDVVSIATPNSLHKPITLASLKAGCHVLCEKPMALNAKEAREMIVASKNAKKRLMINFSYRFRPQSIAMKQQVDSGLLGHIYFARSIWHRRRGMPKFGGWFGQKKMSGGGPLIDLGVHRLDLALWLMGHPKPTYVMGSTYDTIATALAKKQGKPFDVEDFAASLIKFKNGATLILEASWAGYIKEKELMKTRILGTKGGLLQYNMAEGYTFEVETYLEKDGCQYDLKLHDNIPVPAAKSAMGHFVDCIANNKPHMATGHEGLIVMEILDAIYESARTGKPVKIAG